MLSFLVWSAVQLGKLQGGHGADSTSESVDEASLYGNPNVVSKKETQP